MVHEFAKPYEFEDKSYERIEFDLDALKGSDLAAAKKRFNTEGNFTVVPAAEPEYCALLLERLTKLPVDFFNNLPAKEYYALTQKVSNFLLGSA